MKLRIKTETYTVDSAIKFPKKRILRLLGFTETTRQRRSKNFNLKFVVIFL